MLTLIWCRQEHASLVQFDVEHAAMLLKAISQGQLDSGAQFDVSHLFNKSDTMVMAVSASGDLAHINRLMAGTKGLNLDFHTSDIAAMLSLIAAGECASFVGNMTKLESLRCSTYTPGLEGLSMRISTIIGNNTWTHLTHIELGRFHANADELSDIFRHHKSTLRALILKDILLLPGSWLSVFVDLRGGALCEIEVTNLSCGEYEEDLEAFLGDYEINEIRTSPVPSSHPLHAFLFQGGPWVPNMPALLEEGWWEGRKVEDFQAGLLSDAEKGASGAVEEANV